MNIHNLTQDEELYLIESFGCIEFANAWLAEQHEEPVARPAPLAELQSWFVGPRYEYERDIPF